MKNDGVHEKYELQEELGRGKFGVIRRCTNRRTGAELACKTIRKSNHDLEALRNEMKVLQHLGNHTGIIQTEEILEDEESIHLIMELCSGGEIYHEIEQKGRLSEKEALEIFQSLMEAVSYCHSRGVVHRDVKPENIVKLNNTAASPIKLVDFGYAAQFVPGRKLKGMVGTPFYVAPEVLEGKEYTEKVDVWSAGVTLYILLSGIPPFWDETPQLIFECVKRGTFFFPADPWHSISPSAIHLITQMLCKDADKRLSAEQVLRHPWITGGSVSR
eukprot:Gb_04848 [translate_table: standard]